MSPIPPTTASPILPTTPTPDLELTEAEQLEIQKWMKRYRECSNAERYQLLKSKILPTLYALNTHLTKDAWRIRKSVSKIVYIFSIHFHNLKMSANKALVSER